MSNARVMIGSVSSGSGKTTITCGLLQALVNRKMKVASFKCGPDYIDPMFHSKVIGTKSKNLDSFFNDENTLKYLMNDSLKHSDISIIEGVMGYYDGVSLENTKASSYEVAEVTNTPAILVVNARGMYLSIIPLIKGFLDYKKESNIKGVILNNMSKMIYKSVKELIEKELNIKVFGYVPNLKDISIESRHLGLIKPDEVLDLKEKLNSFANILEETLDIDGIISLANKVQDLKFEDVNIKKLENKIKIGVAYDEAFCFYYEDNLKLLKRMNAEIVYFSPLRDKCLPEGISGIIIGGGYPELFAKDLSNNEPMMKDIKETIKRGMPCLAECGGFMYLHETLEGDDGSKYKMVGLICGESYKTNKLGRFGYIKLSSIKDNYFLKNQESILGHEFHYWDSTNCGEDFLAEKTLRKKDWYCMHVIDNLIAGYPHLNYYSNVEVPYRFLKKCEEYRGQ